MSEIIAQYPFLTFLGAVVTVLSGFKIGDWVKALNNRLERRKLTADTDKVTAEAETVRAESLEFITNAARTLVEPLEKRVTDLSQTVSSQGRTIEEMRAEMHENDQLAAEHSGWDYIMEEKARDAGMSYPARPPLRRRKHLFAAPDLDETPTAAVSVQVSADLETSPGR